MKSISFILFLFCAKAVQAHGPDLSSLMIYEQNGKYLLVIKGSLTAFEGEVDYLFGKNAYKTPEEFQLLVSKHFQKNCLVMINGDKIKLSNVNVMLGHETTVFAELLNTPNKFNTIFIKNTLFKDIPNHICELILSINGLSQKQYILNNSNNQEVKLKIENKNWIVMNEFKYSFKIIFPFITIVLVIIYVVFLLINKKKNEKDIIQ